MKRVFLGIHTMKPEVRQVLVLGIGNRLMGDDGIGVHIAEAIKKVQLPESLILSEMPELSKTPEREPSRGKVRISAGETDVDYCLEAVSESDLCIIIDGASTGREPGHVEVIDLKSALEQINAMQAMHDFNLLHAMKREGLMKDGILIAVEIGRAELSPELSPFLRERFQEILKEVKWIIECYLLPYGIRVYK
jgi:hydrogenase maturation protease